MSYQDLLQNVALFQGFRPAELELLAQHAVVHRHPAGELIFQQGDPGTTLYVIVSGQVEIYLLSPAPQSHPIVLQQMTRGDYFGELSLFDNKARSAYARSIEDVELLGITQMHLTDHITRHPRAALVLLEALADRLRMTDDLLTHCAAKNVDAELDKQMNWSDRLADQVATLNGSWAFIVLLLLLTTVWMVVNALPLFGNRHMLDPYPYVFFNLLLAILVALQGPLIVMSQNRKATLDRARAEADYHVNLKNEVNIEILLAEIRHLRRKIDES
ncbi:DUF1003 domain-containing protein [filamentous cyanobacterium LEGE 11480]|uniref:DUF1003 domain-containing protein n=1 Tax=Romeriopsis navalis LEGE 11480 TaxID=2777977 RepID=A0A928VKX0_9CYAN|nr:DUF1003 domain-containing protein [Romeriopsis navalis]MBE9029618.1 DUF1003 domain-containing protein [Romeriopsis navalis LEGE 11480]